MAQRILIMGLPGSGKTYFAERLKDYLEQHSDLFHTDAENVSNSRAQVKWINADDVRKKFNDWDFSPEGRIRQAQRMALLATTADSDFAICDFVAPLPEMRDIFAADCTVWVNTIKHGRFEDTNSMFINPLFVAKHLTDFFIKKAG